MVTRQVPIRRLLLLSALLFAVPALADMGKEAATLKSPAGFKGQRHVTAGIEHYGMGHWDVAKQHFAEAEKEDPQSAVAHYNLALALDKSGDHTGATEHFRRAHDLGKDNVEIQHSPILMKHLKM